MRLGDTTALDRLGLSAPVRAAAEAYPGDGSVLGRVLCEHKGGYDVGTSNGQRLSVVSGKLRRQIESRQAQRPVPGDWLVVELQPGDRAIIHELLPRPTWLRRRAAHTGEQMLAAHVDTLIVVMSLNQDFNLRRLERYYAMARDGHVQPAVFLTKADLVEDADDKLRQAQALAPDVPVIATSQVSSRGLSEAQALLVPGKTHALLGSSGAGKSTLINRWLTRGAQQVTQEIRDDGKGRHTTTHRALFVLENGALVMDTPGMRELGMADDLQNLDDAFADIEALSASCRFRDCRHQGEPGCAVREALEAGRLPAERWQSYDKLRAERAGKRDGRVARQRKR